MSFNKPSGPKVLILAGTALYAAYFFLALYFFRERTMFTDIAHHLFHIVKDSNFAIQNFRFGAAMTQVFPLAARKLDLNLQQIATIYSVCFIIYHFSCFFLAAAVFRNTKMALGILLCSTLIATGTFYWTQSELPQGISFTLLYFAFLSRVRSDGNALAIAAMFLSVFTIAFFHPLNLFVFVFISAFLLLSRPATYDRKLLWSGLFFFLALFAVKKVLFHTDYDDGAMGGVKRLVTTFPHYFGIYSNKRFLRNCLTLYYWLPSGFIAVCWLYARSRQWPKLLLFCGTFLGYLLLVNVSYPDAGTQDYYIENLYLVLCVFLAVPLVFDVFPLLKPSLRGAVISLILITAVTRIYSSHDVFTDRLRYLRSLTKKYGHGKFIIAENRVDKSKLRMTWASAYETWLLSTIENGRTSSILITDNVPSIQWAAEKKDHFVTMWVIFQYSSLPRRYFPLDDQSSSYLVVQ